MTPTQRRLMNDIEYRPRAAGPGARPEMFRAEYLRQSNGNLSEALDRACCDMSEATKGGFIRWLPMSGPAEVETDSGEHL